MSEPKEFSTRFNDAHTGIVVNLRAVQNDKGTVRLHVTDKPSGQISVGPEGMTDYSLPYMGALQNALNALNQILEERNGQTIMVEIPSPFSGILRIMHSEKSPSGIYGALENALIELDRQQKATQQPSPEPTPASPPAGNTKNPQAEQEATPEAKALMLNALRRLSYCVSGRTGATVRRDPNGPANIEVIVSIPEDSAGAAIAHIIDFQDALAKSSDGSISCEVKNKHKNIGPTKTPTHFICKFTANTGEKYEEFYRRLASRIMDSLEQFPQSDRLRQLEKSVTEVFRFIGMEGVYNTGITNINSKDHDSLVLTFNTAAFQHAMGLKRVEAFLEKIGDFPAVLVANNMPQAGLPLSKQTVNLVVLRPSSLEQAAFHEKLPEILASAISALDVGGTLRAQYPKALREGDLRTSRDMVMQRRGLDNPDIRKN